MTKRTVSQPVSDLSPLTGPSLVTALILIISLVLCLTIAFFVVLLADYVSAHTILWIVMGVLLFLVVLR